jgi:hypothetical protein
MEARQLVGSIRVQQPPYDVGIDAYLSKTIEDLKEEFEKQQKQYVETVHYKCFSKSIQNFKDLGKVISKVVVLGCGSLHRTAYMEGNRWMPCTTVSDIVDAVLTATVLGGMIHFFPFSLVVIVSLILKRSSI